MRYDIVLGTSEPQDFQLRDNGAALPGTGLSVALDITDLGTGNAPATLPTIAWLDQAAGKVRVSGVENLPIGNYAVRFKLTDGSGKIGYCPTGKAADVWTVNTVANVRP